MEKMIFLFRRLDGVTRPAFQAHYVADHSPLGVRNCLLLDGYRINLVQTPAAMDSVTEIWSEQLTGFFDAAKNYTGPEKLQEVLDDHNTFIGAQMCFKVEETVVVDGGIDAKVGERAPGPKRVTLHFGRDELGPPPSAATRVVDNRVVEMLFMDDRFPDGSSAELSGITTIRMVWADDEAALTDTGGQDLAVDEYLWVPVPS
jgi:hypothetical protein